MPNAPFLAPERDQAFKRGRPKGGGTTYYAVPGVWFSGQVAQSLGVSGANKVFYHPFFVDTPLIADQLAIEITTLQASSNTRIGIYNADMDNQPFGAPLADSGNIDSSSNGVKTYTPGTPLFLKRGRYVTCLNTDTASIGIRMIRGGTPAAGVLTTFSSVPMLDSLYATQTYGAFPTPPTAWDTVNLFGTGSSPLGYPVMLRVTQP